jgi:hypothetical protein
MSRLEPASALFQRLQSSTLVEAHAAIEQDRAAVREAALREAVDLVREEERHAEATAQEWLKNRGPRSPLVSRAGSVAQAKRDSRKALEKLLAETRTP